MTVKRSGRLLLGAFLAAGLLFFFLRGVDWTQLGDVFRQARPAYLVGIVAMSILTFMVRAWRWGDLIRPVVRVPYWRLVSITYVAFMASLVIPRAAEVVRPYVVSREHKVPFAAVFASIVLERLIDLVTVLLLFAAYLYVLPVPAAQTHGPLMHVLGVAGAFTGLGALVIGALLLVFYNHTERTLGLLGGLFAKLPTRFATLLTDALRGFGEGLAVLKATPRHLAVVFGQSVLLWLCVGATVYCSHLAFGIALPFHASFLVIAFLTVGVAIPTPGMVGGFHEFYKLAMTEVFAVGADAAIAGGITMHFLTQLPVLVIGLVLLSREGLTIGKVTQMSEKAAEQAGVAGAPAASAEPQP